MLTIEDFKPIKLKDKKIFDKFYKDYPPIHSDYVFTTLISWMEYANYHYTFYKDNLIIFSKIDNNIRFRPPIGKRKKEVFDEIISLAKKQNSDYPIGMIDLDTKIWMENVYTKLKLKKHRNFFDYVYLSSDLSNLEGSKFRKIRNRLNKFIKTYDYTIEDISKACFDEVKDFLKRWCLWKDCESDPFLEYEKKAIIYSMENFFHLNLSGILIRINGKIESISVFEKLNFDTSVIHYEKGSPDYDGIYKAINQESARILEKDFKYINRESDMGIPGLRKAKMSYRPHHFIEMYHIRNTDL